jgi:hypothetical protein
MKQANLFVYSAAPNTGTTKGQTLFWTALFLCTKESLGQGGGVKYSGFGRENIPGFIPVYSGLFRMFRDFIPDIPGLFQRKFYEPKSNSLKSKHKCAKMA